jgi:RNA polymerase sigma factor (TIGR02999 family)
MAEVTQLIRDLQAGNANAADELLPLLYAELRQLAAARLNCEKPGQTLQATALVHEAYLRLVKSDDQVVWDGRGHFFAAAAEAMRRILIENARKRKSDKHGGKFVRQDVEVEELATASEDDELLDLDAALAKLQAEDATAGQLVKLRFFAGLTNAQAAEVLSVSPRKADFLWAFARSYLQNELRPC